MARRAGSGRRASRTCLRSIMGRRRAGRAEGMCGPCGMGSGARRVFMGGRRGWSVSRSCFLFSSFSLQRRHRRCLFPVRAGVETGR